MSSAWCTGTIAELGFWRIQVLVLVVVLAMAIEFIFCVTLGKLFPLHWPQWGDCTVLDGVSALPVEAHFKGKDPISGGIKELR